MTRTAIIAIIAALWASPAAPQSCREDAVIVFDGSGSMAELGGGEYSAVRIDEARAAVARVMPEVEDLRRLGLVVYGPGDKAPCHNIDTRFPPTERAGRAVVDAINALRPGGNTPLTEAVRRGVDELEGGSGVVVLVTDGDETCSGRPCSLSALIAREYPGVTVHVVGFRMTNYGLAIQRPEVACLADETGGLFLTTDTVDDLVSALRLTVGCPLFGEVTR